MRRHSSRLTRPLKSLVHHYNWRTTCCNDEAVEVDEEALKEQILVHEELPTDVARLTPDEIATATDDVAADDLLTGIDDEPVDSIPFVDLTESE